MIRFERPWRPAPPRRPTPASAVRSRLVDGGIDRTYSLAFSLRSGSTLIANTLAAHGVGHPAEHFQYPYSQYPSGASRHRFGGTDWFEEVVRSHDVGGWFGTKLAHDHRAHLDAHLAAALDGYRTLDDVLPNHRWLLVSRRDPVAQAVSLWMAERTGRWHVRAGRTDHVAVPTPTVEYDFFGILSKVMILGAQDANWRSFFATHGLEADEIVYDDFVDDPSAVLGRLAPGLGLDPGRFADVDLERDGSLRRIAGLEPGEYSRHRERFMEDFLRIGDPLQANVHGDALETWNSFFLERGWRS